ncbi:hypothetical protein FQN53_005642 [Emmonsiellopsis sp. PD_33]|nr:hypothetical protein FQN53_005642 [Emmonsiellopsis sp. PD_33]
MTQSILMLLCCLNAQKKKDGAIARPVLRHPRRRPRAKGHFDPEQFSTVKALLQALNTDYLRGKKRKRAGETGNRAGRQVQVNISNTVIAEKDSVEDLGASGTRYHPMAVERTIDYNVCDLAEKCLQEEEQLPSIEKMSREFTGSVMHEETRQDLLDGVYKGGLKGSNPRIIGSPWMWQLM